jgi:hypothetical protein
MRKISWACFLFVLGLIIPTLLSAQKQAGNLASKPLYHDPVYDGAADPVVIWNKKEKNGLCSIPTAGPMHKM